MTVCPRLFANALGHRVKLGSKIVRIDHHTSDVTVTYLDAQGAQNQLRAARCVCALPFSTLRQVTLATPFAADKMQAIQSLPYMAAARSYLQTRTRIWQHDPLGALGGLNLVGSDTFAGRLWNTSALQPDSQKGMLHSHMFDVEALEYAGKGSGRVEALRRHMQGNSWPAWRPARSSPAPRKFGRTTLGPAAPAVGRSPTRWAPCARRCGSPKGACTLRVSAPRSASRG